MNLNLQPRLSTVFLCFVCILATNNLPASANASSDGEKAFNAGDFKKAFNCFESSFMQNHRDWQALQSMASCENRLGCYDKAIKYLEKSIELSKLQASHCIIMAGAFEGLGETSKALHWLQLACTLDPNQRMNPAMSVAINRLRDPSNNPTGSINAQDYTSGLVSINKWRKQDLPLRIYVRKNVQLPSYYAEYGQIVRTCFNQWCAATDGSVSYKIVSDQALANIICDYTDVPSLVSPEHTPGLSGDTRRRVRAEDGTTDWANITILIKKKPGSHDLDYSAMTKTTLHEVGHALGIKGHSPNCHDVMFLTTTPELITVLSLRDKKTIYSMYRKSPAEHKS
jgi:hypothetical protein